MKRQRKYVHEDCEAARRALEKKVGALEEQRREQVNTDREILACLELCRRAIMRRSGI